MTAREHQAWFDRAAFALALIALCGVVYAVLARFALDAYPFSGDEYSLALQGQLFAHGAITAPAPPHIEWLRIDHVVIDQLVRSKYPPGAPALLAIGWKLGMPWLVTPIEGVITLLVAWATFRRVLGARPALIGLVVLAFAPLFAFQAASFYAHTATTMFLAISFAAVAAWLARPSDWYLALAGAAIGCAFLVRPFDAVMFGAAMIALRSRRAIVIPALAALPFVVVNLLYQKAAFGGYFVDGYRAYQPTFVALYGADTAASSLSPMNLINPVQLWNHVDILGTMALDWTLPGTVIVALFGAWAIDRNHPARGMRTFSLSIIVVFVLGLLLAITDPDDGAHPRYLSITLLPLAFLAAAGFKPTCDAIAAKFGARVRTIVMVSALVFGLAQLGSFLQDRIPKVWLREGLYQAIAMQHVAADAVVVVRAQHPSRFARNGPFFDGVLYLSAPPDVTAETIAAAYPGREVWEAREGIPWTVRRVR